MKRSVENIIPANSEIAFLFNIILLLKDINSSTENSCLQCCA